MSEFQYVVRCSFRQKVADDHGGVILELAMVVDIALVNALQRPHPGTALTQQSYRMIKESVI